MSSPRLPSPGTVLVCIALVAVCAGSATAASLITGKQIKDGSVTGKDVKNKSLTAKDFKGSLTGAKGDKGDKGDPGAPGAKGDPGTDASLNGVAAGGDLSGSYPNPAIGTGKVTAAKLGAGAVTAEKMSATPAARGESGADQTIVSESLTTLAFGTEVFDNANMLDTTTGTITAPIAGVYMVSAGARWGPDSNGFRSLHLVLNGTSQVASDSTLGDAVYVTNNSVSTILRLDQGDTIIARALQSSGNDMLKVLEDQQATFISAAWLSP